MPDHAVEIETSLSTRDASLTFRDALTAVTDSWGFMKRRAALSEWYTPEPLDASPFGQFEQQEAMTAGWVTGPKSGPLRDAQTRIELHVFDEGSKRRVVLLPVTPRGGAGGAKRAFIEPLIDAYRRADRTASVREY